MRKVQIVTVTFSNTAFKLCHPQCPLLSHAGVRTANYERINSCLSFKYLCRGLSSLMMIDDDCYKYLSTLIPMEAIDTNEVLPSHGKRGVLGRFGSVSRNQFERYKHCPYESAIDSNAVL